MRSHFSALRPVPRAKRALPDRTACRPAVSLVRNFTRGGKSHPDVPNQRGLCPRAHPQWKPHSLRMKLAERAVHAHSHAEAVQPLLRGSYPPQQPCLRPTQLRCPLGHHPTHGLHEDTVVQHVLFRPSCWRMARTWAVALIGRCGGESQEAG